MSLTQTDDPQQEAHLANYWFALALKEYFVTVFNHVKPENFDIAQTPQSTCNVDFVAHVPRDQVMFVSDRLLEVAYGIERRCGVHLSTIVLPIENAATQ